MRLGERRLERLLELGRGLVEDLDLELALKRVLDAARELTGARYAALGILDERERSRWARELHDQTLQDLAGVKVMLSSARRTEDRDASDRILALAIEHVQFSVTALRGLVTDLRHAALDELGVAPALRTLIERVTATTGLDINL